MQLKLLAFAFAICAQTATAGTYSDCTLAIKKGDQAKAKELASALLRFNSFSVDEQMTGAACLTYAMNEEYVFSIILNTFVPKGQEEAVVDEKKKAAAERAVEDQRKVAAALERNRLHQLAELAAKAAKQAQIDTVWKRVYEACANLYRSDPDTTVTNQICLNVFLETGLPIE